MLIGHQVRLQGGCALHDRRRRLGHLCGLFADRFRILDQLGQGLLVIGEQRGSFLEAFDDLLVTRQYPTKRVVDESEPRHRAGRGRLVGIDDECVGERRHRLELVGDYLGAELDRLLFLIVGVAGKIFQLVAQHIAAPHQLVLRQLCAFLLDPENPGEDLAEILEFLAEAPDLIAPRRIGRALHRLIDDVLQAGLGGQRRLAVVFLAGQHEVARQRPVRDQFAVDVARQVGFRDAGAVAGDARCDALETEIGDAHAGGRNGERDGKTEDDLGAKPQGREF